MGKSQFKAIGSWFTGNWLHYLVYVIWFFFYCFKKLSLEVVPIQMFAQFNIWPLGHKSNRNEQGKMDQRNIEAIDQRSSCVKLILLDLKDSPIRFNKVIDSLDFFKLLPLILGFLVFLVWCNIKNIELIPFLLRESNTLIFWFQLNNIISSINDMAIIHKSWFINFPNQLYFVLSHVLENVLISFLLLFLLFFNDFLSNIKC